jgi:PAS domain S-box-containing protein
VEQNTLVLLFRARGPRYPSPRIVILVADDASIARVGQWPLPRRVYADVVRRLQRAGAKTIAFNVQFPIPSNSPADDDEFARACQGAHRVVQASIFHVPVSEDSTQGMRVPVINPPSARFQVTDRQTSCRVAVAGAAALPALQRSAVALGHLNVYPEPDTKLPRIPHLIRYRSGVYPSLALAAAAHFMDLKPHDIIAVKKPSTPLEAPRNEVQLADQRTVPLDVNGETCVNWVGGNRSFPTYTFNELFDGRRPAKNFANTIVLVGITAMGASEHYATPFSPAQPAIELQAQALDDILMNRVLQQPPLWVQLGFGFAFSILSGGLIARHGAKGGMVWVFVLAATLWFMALILLAAGNVYLPVTMPLVAISLSFILVISHQQIHDAHALWMSERRYRTIVDTAQEGIWLVDAQGKTSYVNQRLADMLGYTAQELLGRSVFDFMQGDARSRAEQNFARQRQGGKEQKEQYDFHFRREDGSDLWTIVSSNSLLDDKGQFCGSLAMVADITDRKKSEQNLAMSHEQLRDLAARLESVQEQERTRIAREIHDELGQSLTALKIDLSCLDRSLLEPGNTETGEAGPVSPTEPTLLLRDRIKAMSQRLDSTIETVQEIATQLRPGVLDDLGLEAAIEWLSWDFQERTGIQCEFVCHLPDRESDGDEERGREVSTALFRIAQEALTNVTRHAEAGHVTIKLKQEDRDLTLQVEDNGRGIAQSEITNVKSLGLLGMRERARLLGGQLKIQGSEGQGTTVFVRIPPPERKAEGGWESGISAGPMSYD